MNNNHYVIIMAGGIGTRFWPVSKKSFPKQFMDIMGNGQSLITQTYNRFSSFIPQENIYIVANEEYTDLVQQHIPQIKREQILEEPIGKNTAPCIAFATYYIAQRNPNAVCMIAPSDHLITNEVKFVEIATNALNFASKHDALVTLGIKPSRPDTGYGYIQFQPNSTESGIHEVKTFTEKPTEDIAKTFIESGEFLWNAGIFAWNIKTIINRFDANLNEVHQLFSEINYLNNYKSELEKAYGQSPSISIDYGILEKDKAVFVLPADFGWSDLGTWKSLWEVSNQDAQQNALIGKHVKAFDTKNSLVFTQKEKLIILNGVDNLVVVESDDALLIMNKDREQELRGIVNEVKEKYKGKYN